MKVRRIGAWHRCRIGRRENALVVGRRVYIWKLDDDVINGPADGEQQYRTVIFRSGTAPGLGALVIGLRTRSDRSDVIALGVVWRRRAVATGRVSSRVDPFVMLRSPIPVQALRDRVDHHVLRALDGAVAGDPLTPARLTRRSAEKLVQGIREADADADRLLSSLAQDAIAVAGLDGMRLREERDAVELSLELANVSMEPYMSRLRTAVGPGEAFGASLDPYFVLDCEDDLIAEDLRRFDESATIQRIAGSASVVTDDDLRLTIINVNRRPLEKVHGVDLVYYDHLTDQATVVQYKRLERVEVKNAGRTSSDRIFRRTFELVRQLELMEVDQRLPPSSLADWRLSPSPAFFKFVRGEDFDPDGAAVLRGMYVPADYLRVGIEEGAFDTGPQGGFRLGHSNTRYLSAQCSLNLSVAAGSVPVVLTGRVSPAMLQRLPKTMRSCLRYAIETTAPRPDPLVLLTTSPSEAGRESASYQSPE